jgi:putative transposase
VNPVPIRASKPDDKYLFDRFRKEFNFQRPHEALDRRTPAACDVPSLRKMPNTRPPLEDPDRFEVRDVSANGGIGWHHPGVNVSHVCVGAYVGLEDIDDGVWNVHFGHLKVGRLLERHMRIEDAYGRLKRRR